MEKTKDRTGYLLKNTSIFAISSISTKLIAFFLIPLYTYCLTTTEYGITDLLFTISSVIIPLFTLNISEAIYRFSMDKDADNNKIVSISLLLLIVCFFVSILVIPVVSIFQEYSDYKIDFYFYIVSLATSQVLLMNLKGQEKLKLFAIGNIIHTFLIALFNIYFLIFCKMRIHGYFLAYILSNTIVSFYSFFVGHVNVNIKQFNFDVKLYKEMTKYSILLVPTSFMWWIMNSSDRIMVTNIMGNAANGVYAISYKLPTILSTLSGIFNQAWIYSAVDLEESENKNNYNNLVFKKLVVVLVFVSTLIITFLKPIFKIYVSPSYYSAWKYVPYLVFGNVFLTLGTFLSTYYNVNKDSKGFLYSGIFGAVFNVILNFVFIPILGIAGAALSTCISYIVVFIFRIFDTRKYIKIQFKKIYLLYIILLFMCCALEYSDNILGYILQYIILMITIFLCKKDICEIMTNIFERVRKNKKRENI